MSDTNNSMPSEGMREWQKHVDDELKRLRENQHAMRNDMNAINLKMVESLSGLKDDLSKAKLETQKELGELKNTVTKEIGELKNTLTTAVAEIKGAMSMKQTKTDVWFAVGPTLISFLIAVGALIWWLVKKNP